MKYEEYSDRYTDTPGFLSGIQGSLAEERRKNSPRSFREFNKKARSFNSKHSFNYSQLEQNPNLFEEKLALLAAETSLKVELRIQGFEKEVLGTDQYKKLFSIILYIGLKEKENYFDFLILEKVSKLLRNPNFESKRWTESYRLLQLKDSLGKEQFKELIEDIFYSSTIKDKRKIGKKLLKDLKILYFDQRPVELKQRPRGYSDKGSSQPKHKIERSKSMREIEEELERKRKEILLKQMELFERNLDNILQIQNLETKKEKQEKFRSTEDLFNQELNNLKEEKLNEKVTT